MRRRTEPKLADLSALADGSLPLRRRSEVEAWIADSSERSAQYERERWVVERLNATQHSVHAPARLHARIGASRPQPRPAVRWRLTYGRALSAAVAAAAALIVFVLPAGTPGAPSLSQAAAVAARGPVLPAPADDPHHPATQLAQGVDGVYFPNWSRSLHWRAVGQRSDRLGNRRAVTVYYQWQGRRIAYTIISAPALSGPRGVLMTGGGIAVRALSMAGRNLVTWRRSGDTCVLSGRGVSPRALERLAAGTPELSAYVG